MSDEKRRRLDELLDEGLDAPVGVREEVLQRAGAEDPELRVELEALLAAHGRSDGILDSPLDSPANRGTPGGTVPDPLEIPTRIGIYRIVSELGRGGMGVVFLAERDDGQFSRSSAVAPVRPISEPGSRPNARSSRHSIIRTSLACTMEG